jgi:hypothetical protein
LDQETHLAGTTQGAKLGNCIWQEEGKFLALSKLGSSYPPAAKVAIKIKDSRMPGKSSSTKVKNSERVMG